ncbi:MAG: MotA/TolQ/ExbB proton channel family protein [Myxococcota bacterium]
MNIEDKITQLADLGAGWIMWLLVALSVACLAIVLDRAWVLWRSRERESDRADLEARLRAGDHQGALEQARLSGGLSARIVTEGLLHADSGPKAIEERAAAETERERLRLEQRLGFLGTVGSNAPFVGLLGTVIGIIRAFQEMSRAGGGLTSGLTAEIGEALVATAVGLLVALPAVFFFNLFQRTIRRRMARAGATGREVVASFFDPQSAGAPAE